jgi:thermostable 8-oxoguanine DNA glycosylase
MFEGFGPKQARNFLQALGLTRYEIPIDSRVTDWLNRNGFPLELTAAALADRNYYLFILDAIQRLCEKAEIFPCLLDAAIFSAADSSEFTEAQLSWV